MLEETKVLTPDFVAHTCTAILLPLLSPALVAFAALTTRADLFDLTRIWSPNVVKFAPTTL